MEGIVGQKLDTIGSDRPSQPIHKERTMSVEQNKASVRRIYDEVINQENKAAIPEIFAQDVIVHDTIRGTLQGIEGYQGLLGFFDSAFPHHRVEVHQVIGEGDFVSVLHTHIAHHGGDFMGLPATGKDVRVRGVEVYRMSDGKVAEFWRHDDDAGLLMQLGIVPAPPMTR